MEPEIFEFINQELEAYGTELALKMTSPMPDATPEAQLLKTQIARLIAEAFTHGAKVATHKLIEAQNQCIN